jgi:hypothetical protein
MDSKNTHVFIKSGLGYAQIKQEKWVKPVARIEMTGSDVQK